MLQDLLRYIRKKAPAANSQQNVIELNALLDQIISGIREQLHSKHLDVIPISETSNQFTRKWLGLSVNGEFRGQNGIFKDISSIYRRDNCMLLIPRADSRIFSFTLSLSQAFVEFERYELHFGPINSTGKLSIAAQDIAICVKIAMRLKSNGQIQRLDVTRATLSRCGKYKICVSGFGKLGGNSIAKKVIKVLLNKYKSQMKNKFEEEMKLYIRQTIDKFLT